MWLLPVLLRSPAQVQQYRHLNERYCRISEENRQLYNTVQDLRGNIRVFCRVRPRGATGDASASMVEVCAGREWCVCAAISGGWCICMCAASWWSGVGVERHGICSSGLGAMCHMHVHVRAAPCSPYLRPLHWSSHPLARLPPTARVHPSPFLMPHTAGRGGHAECVPPEAQQVARLPL